MQSASKLETLKTTSAEAAVAKRTAAAANFILMVGFVWEVWERVERVVVEVC